jgi:predicted DNA-binding transcriptional regulator AlpA
MSDAPDPLLTPADLSAWLGVSVGMLANWRYRGVGPQFVKMGRSVRYNRADVHQWIEDNRRQQTETP